MSDDKFELSHSKMDKFIETKIIGYGDEHSQEYAFLCEYIRNNKRNLVNHVTNYPMFSQHRIATQLVQKMVRETSLLKITERDCENIVSNVIGVPTMARLTIYVSIVIYILAFLTFLVLNSFGDTWSLYMLAIS